MRRRTFPGQRWIALLAVPLLAAGLSGCGGSSDEDPVPLYAGTYFVVLNKTVDDCNTGVRSRLEAIQTVSQSGRSVTLASNDLVLHGQVDPDDLGISVSAQTMEQGVRVTTGMVYRATATPGLFDAGFSVVGDAGSARCIVAYGGQAQLQ